MSLAAYLTKCRALQFPDLKTNQSGLFFVASWQRIAGEVCRLEVVGFGVRDKWYRIGFEPVVNSNLFDVAFAFDELRQRRAAGETSVALLECYINAAPSCFVGTINSNSGISVWPLAGLSVMVVGPL